MTDSTKRVLRTVYQLVVALITIAPVLLTVLSGSPVEAQVVIFAGWMAAVSAIINKLEDTGLLPAWLKSPSTPTVAEPDIVPGEVEAAMTEDLPEPPAYSRAELKAMTKPQLVELFAAD